MKWHDDLDPPPAHARAWAALAIAVATGWLLLALAGGAMTRGQLLARHMRDQRVSDHELATALGVRLQSVTQSVVDLGWFTESAEWRLRLYLELWPSEFKL